VSGRGGARRVALAVAALGLAAVAVPAAVPVAPAGATAASVAPFRSPEVFVRQQFRDFQDRDGASPELAPFVTGLADGTMSAGAVVDQVAHGGSAAERIGNVTRLYTAYFQRLPDVGGLEYWTKRSASGWTLNRISATFAASSEFRRKYGTLSNAGFVDRAFLNVFGRAADPSGRAYWIAKLAKGTSRGVVMVGFSQSNEYRRKQAAATEVVVAYRGLLRRIPVGVEAAEAVTRVQADGVAALASDLLALPAYAARFPAPGAPGGVTATAVDDQVTVSWSPAPTSGTALSGYVLRVLHDGVADGPDRPLGPGATSAVVSGLDDGETYAFTVTAHTALRDGPAATAPPVTIDIDVAWSTYQGGPAHDGVQRFGTVPATPAFQWEADLGLPIEQVVVGDDRIFVMTESQGVGYEATGSSVYALDPDDGHVLWGPVVFDPGTGDRNHLGYGDRRLVVGSDDGVLQALDSRTGATVWSKDLQSISSLRGLTIYDGSLYTFDDRDLLAIDVADGAVRWRTTTENNSGTPGANASGVYVAQGCGVAYRFTDAGSKVWGSLPNCQGGGFGVVTLAEGRMWPSGHYLHDEEIRTQALGTVVGRPLGEEAPAVLGATTIYNEDAVLRGTDTTSGVVRWSKGGNGRNFVGAPVINAGRAYARSNGAKVNSFDVTTGADVWTHVVSDDLAGAPNWWDVELGDLVLGDGLLLVPVSVPWPDSAGSLVAYG